MYGKFLKFMAHITVLLVLGGWLSTALAGEVKLAWNAPTTYTDGTPVTAIAGYHLYLQDSAGGSRRVDIGNQTTYTLTGLTGGLTYTIAVTATDTSSTGHESSLSNSITVPVPLAQGDTVTDPAGTSLTIAVLANDTDPAGQSLTITSVTQGAHGTVTISGTSVIYTPAAGFVGTDSFTYTVTDGQGAYSTATVIVNVTSGNQPPTASADTVTIAAGTSVTIAVLTNDTDPNGNPLTITAVTQGANGTVTFTNTSVTYTPQATFVGTDSFTYTISDGQGASATATVTVTVMSDRTAFLVAAYSFNEGSGTTVSDASGNKNTGTISGATWTTAGKFGGALVFNGTSAKVTIPDAPSLRLTTDMTLAAWVKPSKVTSAWRDVIYKGDDNYYLEATSTTNSRPAGGGRFGGPSIETFGTAALPTNTWSHLAVTYDGAALRLYVNGVQVSSRAQTGNLVTSSNPLQIGGDSIYGQYFKGTIDEVRIYNQALLPSEIQSDMQKPVMGTAVAAYSFNASSGTTAADVSGNGNTGVLKNGPLWVAGKNGNGLRLDGVNDYVDLSNPATLRLTGSMTLSAWINSSAFPFDDAAIISKRQSANVGYQLDTTIDRGPRTVGFKISDAAGNTVARYGATTLVTNTWYHVAGVYDATNRTMNVYVNGKLDNGTLVGTIPSTQPSSTQNVNIGQRPGAPGTFNFAGVLDDVRIYNRALSQAEIQVDMNTPMP
jgi:hypothetical protein